MLVADALLARPDDVVTTKWTDRDTILYNLGIGFGPAAIADSANLRYVLEDRLHAFPTMATVMGMSVGIFHDDRYGIDFAGILHGEEWIELHRPIPAMGSFEATTCVEKIWDRGADKGAIMQTRKTIRPAGGGDPIADTRTVLMLRRNGGFGGSSEGAPQVSRPPEREPDGSVTLTTQPDQALIYRLSGDRNPLHADPEVARQAGFPGPILHGMATYGIVARAIVEATCDGDEARLAGFGLRFSSPVYPGEGLRTDYWLLDEGKVAFQTTVLERNLVVATGGQARIRG